MRSVYLRHLVDHDDIAQNVETGATKLFGPWDAEQTELAHLPDAFPGKLRLRVELGGHWTYFAVRELADHVADREVLLGEVERVVHGFLSRYCSREVLRVKRDPHVIVGAQILDRGLL